MLLSFLWRFSVEVVLYSVFMAIPSRAAFGQLATPQQVMVLLVHATPLLKRQEAATTIGLYRLGAYFVELRYTLLLAQVQQCRTLTRAQMMQEYAGYGDLPA